MSLPQENRGGKCCSLEMSVRWKVLSLCPIPAASCSFDKMSVVNLDTLSQDDLKKRVASLISLDDWADSCLQCERPVVLHKSGACTRSDREPPEIIMKVWKEFKDRTKSIVLAMKAERRKEDQDNVLLQGLKDVLKEISVQPTNSLNVLVDSLGKKTDDVVRPVTKLTKPAKVPVWTKDLTLEVYVKQIQAWSDASDDIPVNTKYHDFVESLKLNKEIHGLPRFIGEHVLPVLDKLPDQTVKKVLELLEIKYGRSRIEKVEECVKDWLEFKEDIFEEEDEFLFAMKEINQRRIDLEISEQEWFSVWMLGKAKKRKRIDNFKYQALRNVIKEGGEAVVGNFEKMYRELRVEGNRKKLKETLYTEGEKETLYMGSESEARKRYQGGYQQRGNSFQRRESFGRGRERSLSRGRYEGGGRSRFDRSFVRGDSSFVQRPGSKGRQDSRGRDGFRKDRSRTPNRTPDFSRCIGCKCEACEKMRKLVLEGKLANVNEVATNVQLCEGEEMVINYTYTDLGKQVMILDIGAPVSLSGITWMTQYLKEFDLKIEDLKSFECWQPFRFGPSKRYLSVKMVELPVMVTRLDGKEDVLVLHTYLVEAEVPLLCGKRTLELWKFRLDGKRKVLEIEPHGFHKEFRVIDTQGNHYGIVLETRGQNCVLSALGKEENEEDNVLFLDDEKENLCSMKAVRKVHEINHHKKKDQLVAAYRNAGWLSPELVSTIDTVVKNCKVCQKFEKSVSRPRVTLPKSTSFNEVVTMNLKEFGTKYVLWMVDSFTRFMQGKLIANKKVNTVIEALNSTWCMNLGYPSIGFFADNGGEFANARLDEYTSKLGLTVKFGPAYSPWSNGINERNHASADLTIKKLMEEKRTSLTDALVKAAAWAHNTSINKLGFSPLQLVTGKAVTLPGLTTGNVATESMTESEAVQRTVESLSRVVSEFREADMRKKLKECQNFRIPSYQHLRNYVEGDKVWYQPLNGTAWYGPAAVLCQRGSTV